MLPPLISVDEFAVEIVDGIADEDLVRAGTLIARVSAKARELAGQSFVDPDTHLLLGVPDVVLAAVVEASVRRWNTPISVLSETIGPTTTAYDRAAVAGTYFTEAEERSLRALRPSQRPSLGTIQTDRGMWGLGHRRGRTWEEPYLVPDGTAPIGLTWDQEED